MMMMMMMMMMMRNVSSTDSNHAVESKKAGVERREKLLTIKASSRL